MANKTSQRTIEAQERRKKAVELRRMGWSYSRIANQIGMTKSSAHKAVTKALSETQGLLDADADLLRAQEADRLDSLQSFFWIDASKGNIKAAERIMRIMERRAKLLGLDAPTLLAQTDTAGDDVASGVFVVPAPAGSLDEWMDQVHAYQATKEPKTDD